MGPAKIDSFQFSERFKKEYQKAKPDIKGAVGKVFRDLQANPNARRCHPLHGYRPQVFVADVFPNHSWQLTFEMKGTIAMLRRLGSHASIDDEP